MSIRLVFPKSNLAQMGPYFKESKMPLDVKEKWETASMVGKIMLAVSLVLLAVFGLGRAQNDPSGNKVLLSTPSLAILALVAVIGCITYWIASSRLTIVESMTELYAYLNGSQTNPNRVTRLKSIEYEIEEFDQRCYRITVKRLDLENTIFRFSLKEGYVQYEYRSLDVPDDYSELADYARGLTETLKAGPQVIQG